MVSTNKMKKSKKRGNWLCALPFSFHEAKRNEKSELLQIKTRNVAYLINKRLRHFSGPKNYCIQTARDAFIRSSRAWIRVARFSRTPDWAELIDCWRAATREFEQAVNVAAVKPRSRMPSIFIRIG